MTINCFCKMIDQQIHQYGKQGDCNYNDIHNIMMFHQIFLSPQVKRSLIIINKLLKTSRLTSCRTT